jgi:hypothetical protein
MVTNRDGLAEEQTLKSSNYCAPITETLNNAPDPIGFWDTEHDKARLIPKNVTRVSEIKLDGEYDWDDGITYDDDADDSDYVG